jgi:hypothetical protein
MATTKGSPINKSAEIRRALEMYPNRGPSEIARLLSRQHGVKFRANSISTIKSRLAQKAATASKPAAPAAPAGVPSSPKQSAAAGNAVPAASSIATMVSNLQGYIQRLGKADLHRLIDTL